MPTYSGWKQWQKRSELFSYSYKGVQLKRQLARLIVHKLTGSKKARSGRAFCIGSTELLAEFQFRSKEHGVIAQHFLDADQLVVFCDTIGA